MIKITDWTKNIAKSTVYAAAEVLGENFSTFKEFKSTNTELFKETYSAIKNYKTTFARINKAIKESDIYVAAGLGVQNILEDIKTGNFYNTEREEKLTQEYGGDLMADENWNFDEMDFDWEEKNVSDGEKIIASAIKKNNKINSVVISETIAKVGKASIDSSHENTTMLYLQNERLLGGISKSMEGLREFTQMNAEKQEKIQAKQNENTTKFFSKIEENTNKMVAELDELVKLQRTVVYGDDGKQKNRKANTVLDITSNGVPDLKAYGKLIKENAFNYLNQQTGGILSMGDAMGGANLFAQFAADPMKSITKGMMEKAVSTEFKNVSAQFDESMKGWFTTLIARLNDQAKNGTGISKLLGQIFGLKTDKESDSIDTSKYKKGPISFDGVTKKAITEVIPFYLRKMTAMLTGEEEMVFDYNTGKWNTRHAVKKAHDDWKLAGASQGTATMKQVVQAAIGGNLNSIFSNKTQQDRFEKEWNKYENALYHNGGDPTDILRNPMYYGLSEEFTRFVQKALGQYKNQYYTTTREYTKKGGAKGYRVSGIDRSKGAGGIRSGQDLISSLFSLAGDIFETKAKRKQFMESLENDGNAIERILYSEGQFGNDIMKRYGTDEKYSDLDEKKAYKSPLVRAMLYMKDEYDYSLFDYLQSIKKDLSAIRNNGGIGIGALLGVGSDQIDSSNFMRFEKSSDIKSDWKWRRADYGKKLYDEAKEKETESYERDMAKRYEKWMEKPSGARPFFAESYEEAGQYIYSYQTALENAQKKDYLDSKKELAGIYKNLAEMEFISEQEAKKFNSIKYDSNKKIKSQLDSLTTTGEKFALIRDYAITVAEKPFHAVNDALISINDYVTDIFFGKSVKKKGEDEEDEENDNSLFGIVKKKFKEGFDNMGQIVSDKFSELVDGPFKKIKKDVFDPIKEFLIGKRADSESDYEGGLFSGLMKSFKDSFDELVADTRAAIKEDERRLKEEAKKLANKNKEDEDDNSTTTTSSTQSSTNNVSQQQAYINEIIERNKRSNYLPTEYEIQSITNDSFKTENRQIQESDNDRKMQLAIEVNKRYCSGAYSYIDGNGKIHIFANPRDRILFSNAKKCNEYVDWAIKNNYTDTQILDIETVRIYLELLEIEEGISNQTGNKTDKNGNNLVIQRFMNNNTNKTQFTSPRTVRRYLENNNIIAQRLAKRPDLNLTTEDLTINDYMIWAKEKFGEDWKRYVLNSSVDKYILDRSKSIIQSKLDDTRKKKEEEKKKKQEEIEKNRSIAEQNDIELENKLKEKYFYDYMHYDSEGNAYLPSNIKNKSLQEIIDFLQKKENRIKTSNYGGVNVKSLDEQDSNILKLALEALKEKSKINEENNKQKNAVIENNNILSRIITPLDKIAQLLEKFTSLPLIGNQQQENTSAQQQQSNIPSEITWEYSEGENLAKGGINLTGKPLQSVVSSGEIINGNVVPPGGPYITTIPENGVVINPADKATRARQASQEKSFLNNLKMNAEPGSKDSDTKEFTKKVIADMDELNKKHGKSFTDALVRGGAGFGIGYLIGQPFLAAGIGAASSLYNKSNDLSNLLFGDAVLDENGKVKDRLDNGLISKEITKAAPDIRLGGAIGTIAGLLTPLGPIPGLLIGASAGFAKNTGMIQDNLFGATGIIDKEKLQKALPSMGIGAAAGSLLLAGLGSPLGIIGNALIGSAAGYVSTTDEFKDILLGEKGSDGKRHGGIHGILDTISRPIKSIGETLLEAGMTAIFGEKVKNGPDGEETRKGGILGSVKEYIIKPFADSVAPIVQEIKNKVGTAFDFLDKLFGGIGFNKQHFLDWAGRIGGEIGKIGVNVGRFVLATKAAPLYLGATAVKGLGNHLRRKQIRRGTANYMTAQQRLDYRKDHKVMFGFGDAVEAAEQTAIGGIKGLFGKKVATPGIITDKYKRNDEALAAMSANMTEDELQELYSALNYNAEATDEENLRNIEKPARTELDENAMNITKGIKDRDKIVKKVNAYAFSGDFENAEREIKSNNQLSDDQKKQYLSILNRYRHTQRTNKMTFANAKKKSKNIQAELKKLGIDLDPSNAKQVKAFSKNLQTEIIHKRAGLTEEELEKQLEWKDPSNPAVQQVNLLKELIDVMKGNKYEYKEEINKKTKETYISEAKDIVNNPKIREHNGLYKEAAEEVDDIAKKNGITLTEEERNELIADRLGKKMKDLDDKNIKQRNELSKNLTDMLNSDKERTDFILSHTHSDKFYEHAANEYELSATEIDNINDRVKSVVEQQLQEIANQEKLGKIEKMTPEKLKETRERLTKEARTKILSEYKANYAKKLKQNDLDAIEEQLGYFTPEMQEWFRTVGYTNIPTKLFLTPLGIGKRIKYNKNNVLKNELYDHGLNINYEVTDQDLGQLDNQIQKNNADEIINQTRHQESIRERENAYDAFLNNPNRQILVSEHEKAIKDREDAYNIYLNNPNRQILTSEGAIYRVSLTKKQKKDISQVLSDKGLEKSEIDNIKRKLGNELAKGVSLDRIKQIEDEYGIKISTRQRSIIPIATNAEADDELTPVTSTQVMSEFFGGKKKNKKNFLGKSGKKNSETGSIDTLNEKEGIVSRFGGLLKTAVTTPLDAIKEKLTELVETEKEKREEEGPIKYWIKKFLKAGGWILGVPIITGILTKSVFPFLKEKVAPLLLGQKGEDGDYEGGIISAPFNSIKNFLEEKLGWVKDWLLNEGEYSSEDTGLRGTISKVTNTALNYWTEGAVEIADRVLPTIFEKVLPEAVKLFVQYIPNIVSGVLKGIKDGIRAQQGGEQNTTDLTNKIESSGAKAVEGVNDSNVVSAGTTEAGDEVFYAEDDTEHKNALRTDGNGNYYSASDINQTANAKLQSNSMYQDITNKNDSTGGAAVRTNSNVFERGIKAVVRGKLGAGGYKFASKVAVKTVKNVGKVAIAGATGGIGGALKKLIELLKNGLKGLLSSDKVVKIISKISPKGAEKLGKKLVQEGVEKVTKEVTKEAAKTSTEIIGKAVAKSTVKYTTIPLAVAFMLADFITGWNEAVNILGITRNIDELTDSEKFMAGLAKAISGLIIFVSPSKIVSFILDHIYPIINEEAAEQLKQEQQESIEALKAFNEENNTNLTIEEYNNSHNATTWMKFKSKAADTVKSAGNKISSLFKKDESESADNVATEQNMIETQDIATNAEANDKLTPIKGKKFSLTNVVAKTIGDSVDLSLNGFGSNMASVYKRLEQMNADTNQKINEGKLTPADNEYWQIKLDDSGSSNSFINAMFKMKESFNRLIKSPFSMVTDSIANTVGSVMSTGSASSTSSSSTGGDQSNSSIGSVSSNSNISNTSSASSTSQSKSTSNIFSRITSSIGSFLGNIFGKAKYGKGYGDHIYQRDYHGSFQTIGDSERQTVADSGCGPAAAAAVMNQFGMNGNMNNAVNYALKGGFKEINGGTYPEYFDSYLGQNGITTQNLDSNADVVNSLINGKPVIMMGQDQSDSGNTPYGSQYSHYVVATGLDQNGNVIVEDSEDPNGSTRYNLQDTLNNTSLKIGTAMGRGKTKYGRAKESVLSRYTTSMANAMYQPYLKFVSQFVDVNNDNDDNKKKTTSNISASTSTTTNTTSTSSTFNGNGTLGDIGDMDTNAKMIWCWFRAQGFSKESCAAILGNMQQESSIQPKAPSKSYNDSSDVTDGIIQWDPFSQHRKWCESNGISDYYDLEGQLKHILDSINKQWKSNYSHDGYMYLSKTDFINATDVASATVAFERCIEISGDWRSNRDSKRIKYAQEWFSKLAASDGASGTGKNNKKKLFDRNKSKYGRANETTTIDTTTTDTVNVSSSTSNTQQAKNEGTSQITYGGISDLLKGYMSALFPDAIQVSNTTTNSTAASTGATTTVANTAYSGDGTVIEGDFETNRASCWRFLRANGFSPAAAAGCIGNFVQECGLIRKNIHVRESNKNNGGIIGWTPFTKHENWCANNGVSDPESLESQLKHIVSSIEANDWDNTQYVGLKGAKKVNSGAEFRALTDIPTATMSIERNIILWEGWSTSDPGNSRIKYAQDAYNAYCSNDGNITGTGRGKKSAKQLLKEKAKFYEGINKKLSKRPAPTSEELKRISEAKRRSGFVTGIAEDGDDYIISAFGRANEELGGRYAATEENYQTWTPNQEQEKPIVAGKDYSNALSELEETIAEENKGALLNNNAVKEIATSQAKNEGNASVTYGGTSDLLNGYIAALFPNLIETNQTTGTTSGTVAITGSIDEASLGIQDSFMSKRSGSTRTTTNAIVVHYWGDESGNATAAGIKRYWESIGCSVYANYIIGPDGDVLRCCPEEESAPCSNTVNSTTISIENAHYDKSKNWQIKEKTYDKLVRMCAYLCLKYGLDPLNGGIMRHYDVKCSKYPNGKGCPPWFIACTDKTDSEPGTDDANNSNYTNFKNAVATLMKQNSTSAVGRGRANAMAHKKKNTKLFHSGIAEDGDDTGMVRKKRSARAVFGRQAPTPTEDTATITSNTNGNTLVNNQNNSTSTTNSTNTTNTSSNSNTGSVTIGDSASLMSKLGSYIGNSVKQTYGAYYYTIFGDESTSGSTSDEEDNTNTNTVVASTAGTTNNANTIGMNNTLAAAMQICYKMGVVPYSHDNNKYTIELNGQTIKVRPDCSGYMSAVIYAMGYSIVNSSGNKTHAILARDFATEGCSKYIRNADGSATSDWIDMPFSKSTVQPGDIIAYSAHTEMYWYTDSNGKLRGFSGGSQGIEKSYYSAKAYIENGTVTNEVPIVSCHTRILRFTKNSGLPVGGTGRGKATLKNLKNKFSKGIFGRQAAVPKEEYNNENISNSNNTSSVTDTISNSTTSTTNTSSNSNTGSVTIGDSASLMSKLGSYIGNSVKQTYGAYYYTIFGDESGSSGSTSSSTAVTTTSGTSQITGTQNTIVAALQCFYAVGAVPYSQSNTSTFEVNGISITARHDCSGMMSAAIKALGYKLDSSVDGGGGARSADMSKEGFSKHIKNADGSDTSDWIDLPYSESTVQAGDIVAYNGHVEMFWYINSNGGHRGISSGSTEGIANGYTNGKELAESGSIQSKGWYIYTTHTRIIRYVGNATGGIPTNPDAASYGATSAASARGKGNKTSTAVNCEVGNNCNFLNLYDANEFNLDKVKQAKRNKANNTISNTINSKGKTTSNTGRANTNKSKYTFTTGADGSLQLNQAYTDSGNIDYTTILNTLLQSVQTIANNSAKTEQILQLLTAIVTNTNPNSNTDNSSLNRLLTQMQTSSINSTPLQSLDYALNNTNQGIANAVYSIAKS